jgi:curli biogenesis system outer membrane secretion channel CsgG
VKICWHKVFGNSPTADGVVGATGVIRLIIAYGFVIVLASLISVPKVFAQQVVTVNVSGVGVGADRDAALRNALTEAVMQVSGASLSSARSIVKAAVTTRVAAEGKDSRTKISAKTQTSASTVTTDGEIAGFQIVSESQLPSGSWRVEVSADIYRYQAPVSSKRLKIAVPFVEISARRPHLLGLSDASQIANTVTTAIEKVLVATRKFAVLTRTDFGHLSDELSLLASDATARAERAKLGQMLGGDFILLADLVDVSGRQEVVTIQITGQRSLVYSGGVSLNIKLVNAATGEVAYAKSYRAPASEVNSDPSRIANSIGNLIADGLIDHLYPALVVSADGPNVVLNIGGESFQVGELLNIYVEGDALIDPYTGETLDAPEIYVGLGEIVRVAPKVSYVVMLDGSPVQVGMIARRAGEVSDDLQTDKLGDKGPKKKGVSLPFD